MPLTKKQRWARYSKRPVYKRRRRIAFFTFVLVAALIGFRACLFSDTFEETSGGQVQRVVTPTVEQAPEAIDGEEVAKNKEQAKKSSTPPKDPTLYLTVPKLGLYGHTVRNDDSEAALDLGAIKLPYKGFPWEEEDTNTYIACHRLGWPGTESFNQCLNLPSIQKGDEVFLEDANGTTYRYRVSEMLAVRPNDS